MNLFIRPSVSNTSSYTQKWGRRLFYTTGAITTIYISTDYFTANSLTRSLRAIKTAASLAYMYKTTSPTTPEEYSNLHRTAAEGILNLCLQNEGLYIKLGQGLNALNHILPPEYMDVLKVLLDNAPSVPLKDIRKIILEETGKTVEELFSYFDPIPVASASIAQVHRAWLKPINKNDKSVEVAVKVQKPYVRYQVFWDLETYRFVTWAIGILFDLPLGWAKQTVMDGIRREINFTIEAHNAERIREDFASNSNVYIPKVYEELVTPRLLVLEWIDAVKLIDVDIIRKEFDEVIVLKTVFDTFGDMIFKYGFVHCDPHGANLLIRRPLVKSEHNVKENSNNNSSQTSVVNKKCKNPQVVLLDFGLCCPETERFRMEYALLFKSIVSQDMESVKKIVASWGITDPEVFASIQIQKPYTAFRDGNKGEITKQEVIQMQTAAHQRAQTLLANQEQIPRELPLVGRSIDILRGLNRLYGTPINRVNMFVRRAVAGLGPIHSFDEVQRYLAQLHNISSSNSSNSSLLILSKEEKEKEGNYVFGDIPDEHRRKQAAAAVQLRLKRDASFLERMHEFIFSLYRRVMFECVLLFLDLHHVIVRWYNFMLETLLPAPTAATLHRNSLEDLLEKKELEFVSISQQK